MSPGPRQLPVQRCAYLVTPGRVELRQVSVPRPA